MRLNVFTFFTVFIIPFVLPAQYEDQMSINAEYSLTTGPSIPIGKYAILDASQSENGNATPGWGIEFIAAHRFLRVPYLSIRTGAFYYNHGYNNDGLQKLLDYGDLSFDPPYIGGKNWSTFNIMAGSGLEFGKRLKVGVDLMGGLFFYNGHNMEIINVLNDTIRSVEWEYGGQVAIGYRASGYVMYQINKNISVFANGAYIAGFGERNGLELNSVIFPNGRKVNTGKYNVAFDTKFSFLNVGIGIRYIFRNVFY